nr:MAG TPA: hypothetical protein [Caudoviricetes sp.]
MVLFHVPKNHNHKLYYQTYCISFIFNNINRNSIIILQ